MQTLEKRDTMTTSNKNYKILSGISEIAHNYDGYLLDIWGLLHDGIKPFPGVIDCLEKLKSLGKKTLLLSNSPRRGHLVVAQLENLGITLNHFDQILTSGDATYIDLIDQVHHIGRNCYFIGHSMHEGMLGDVDLKRTDNFDEANFILNMWSEDLGTSLDEMIERLKPALEKDILMICPNPDMSVMIGNRKMLCPGSLAKAYDELGGRVHYHGKPL